MYGNQCHSFHMYIFVNTGIDFLKSHHRQASLMTAVIKNLKAITELTPSSSEEDAKNTYDSWASSYEAVS